VTWARARFRPVAVLAGAPAVVVVALTACTGSEPPAPAASAIAPDAVIAWAVDQQPTQYNPSSAVTPSPTDVPLLAGVLGGFWRYRPDGTVERDPQFGSYRKVSDDPLTIRYTIAARAVWSDGVPIECDDVALAWLANSGVTGDRGFSSQDVARYRDMNRPKCDAGDKVVTISYRTPSADWEAAFGPGSGTLLPAHVVERQAGLTQRFVDYLDNPTSPDLARAIAFWNSGWTLVPGQVRKDLLLSSGPYLLDSWQAGESITLRTNPRWWGRPAEVGAITVRFLAADQQVEALGAGRLQVIDPVPDAGVVAALRALGARVRVATGDRFSFEHLDFNLGGEFADRTLREAFARCVPRQQFVDTLVKPLNPAARVLDSRLVLPFQPAYAAVAPAGRPYDAVDVAGARRLLAGRTPTVRVGWHKDPEQLNPTRLQVVALLKASCGQAGFQIVDAGTPTFLTRELPAGGYDVALFSWTGSPAATSSRDIYAGGGASNLNGYRSDAVDRLFARLARELDPARRTDLLRQIDAILWRDLPSVPLFADPAIMATTADVAGAEGNPTETGLAWNVAAWARV
jgi:peptide/nickel transport system substrate-binding protein